MVHSGSTVPGSTSPTPLVAAATTPTKAGWVLVQARSTNTGTIRIGDSTITSSAGGSVLVAGASIMYPWNGAPNTYDLQGIFIISSAGGTEGVDWSYGK